MENTKVNYFGQAKLKIVLGAFCVWFFASLSVMANSPQIYSPFSFPVAIPALIVSILDLSHAITIVLGALPLVVIYAVWIVRGLIKQRESISIDNLSVIIVTATALMSVIFNAMSFQHGLEYQGMFHTLAICVINVLCILILPVLYWRHFKQKSVSSYVVFFIFYFSWLGFIAFPWFGELL
jgi:hypothetical protein